MPGFSRSPFFPHSYLHEVSFPWAFSTFTPLKFSFLLFFHHDQNQNLLPPQLCLDGIHFVFRSILLSYVFDWVTCIYVHVYPMHAVPWEARRGQKIPQTLELQMTVSGCAFLELNPGPHQEQQVLWAAEPTLWLSWWHFYVNNSILFALVFFVFNLGSRQHFGMKLLGILVQTPPGTKIFY